MASTTLDKKAIKAELAADSRDISGIWNEAINRYNKTANEHESGSVTLARPTYKDAQAMKDFGYKEMRGFHFYRNKDEKIDKLRMLFMRNIDLIGTGSKQLLDAVSTSFPPALAISTAITFVLTGFQSQRADYDVVANFFEDMNNFLERVTIIEKRVPMKSAYQNALIDVFTSMLSLCAVARKFIMQGRFKKWVINSFFGGDEELSGGRKQMDTSLTRLQLATEFAILDNSENMLEQQVLVSDKLAHLRRELDRNGEIQDQVAAKQNAALEQISYDIQEMRDDIKKLLSIQQTAKSIKNQTVTKDDEVSGNVVRHFYGVMLATKGIGEPVPDMLAVLANLEKSQVEDTGTWLFEHAAWLAWVEHSTDSPSSLWLDGGPGMGKTHLSLAMYRKLLAFRKPKQEVCVVYFSCHRPDEQRRHVRNLLRNCAIQIADQSPVIRQRLEAMWRNLQIIARVESTADHEGLRLDATTIDNDIFIYENFSEASSNQLFVVVDGINQFYKEEFDIFVGILHKVRRMRLRIKFVITTDATARLTTDTMKMTQSQTIQVGKDQILPDLRKILWKGINSEDSAYDGLRKLSKHRKQKLARTIEETADNLLYVDEMLRFLASGAREGNIQNLLDSIPTNLAELYEVILQRSLQRFPPDSIQSLKSIIMWLTFSYHPLTLEQLGLLAKSADLSSERILPFVLQFFEVDIISKDTTSSFNIELAELFEDVMEISIGNSLLNDKLRLQVRNRATEIFFCGAGPMHNLRTSYSDAHRRLFLDTVDIILHRKTSNESLYEYSVEHSLIHWHHIVPEQHTKEEQTQICTAFNALIHADRFAEGLARHPYCQYLGQITEPYWEERWSSWSEHARKLDMAPNLTEYWENPDSALYPLVKVLVRCWLGTIHVETAVKAWRWAFDIGETVRGSKSLNFNGAEGVRQLAGILGAEQDSLAHFAIASVMADASNYRISHAIGELHLALDGCRDAAFRSRCHIQLASVYVQYEDWKSAVDSCKLALDSEQMLIRSNASEKNSDLQGNGRAESDINVEKIVGSANTASVGNLVLQHSTRAEALRIQAMAMKNLGMNKEAAQIFREARQISPEIVQAEHLSNELLCLQEDPVSMIDRLLSFNSIDRLRYLTGSFRVGELGHTVEIPSLRVILPASVMSQNSGSIVKIYRDIIKALDAEQAGAPIRVDLARVLWRLRYNAKFQSDKSFSTTGQTVEGDHTVAQPETPRDVSLRPDGETREVSTREPARSPEQDLQSFHANASLSVKEAKLLLNQVLDSVSEERKYKLTDRNPLSVAQSALLLMTDILLEEFRSSKRVEDKVQILLQAKELPRRKFLASQPLITDEYWNPYNTTIARMLRKIGSMSEYEQVMQATFEKSLAGYSDNTRYNDHLYLKCLSRIFTMEPLLHKLGETLSLVEMDEGATYCCDGICLPVTVFDNAELDAPYYQCLVCSHSLLCQSCHRTRMQWNTDLTTKSTTDLDFCCPHGQYILIPVEDRDEREECVYLEPTKEGDERTRIELHSLPKYIGKAWRDAWDDLASGI